ncbi:glutamate-rich protein 6-like isoform X3 [Mya arenaria]|uniref:glutamate-rich protein 6-like isoform X3 n=1 Tax=Mya arenaria TaxID=6604 RepID=UPI0022E4F0E8|nr:glutamate-rich protein 6-like isoform X3 [Mya arenaria]
MADRGESARSRSEFTNSKPLPPIGSKDDDGDRSESQATDRSRSVADDDTNSNGNAFDRPGEGAARPRIVRAFRPEMISDEEMENEKRLRSVSFEDQSLRTFKKKTYDGREIMFATLDTQTDWDWVEKEEMMEITQPAGTSTPDGKDGASQSPKPSSSKLDIADEKATPDIAAYQMPYSDEYGIPILDLSSDTDDSSDEESVHRKVKDDRTFMPSVGPPNILQYQRESEKHDIPVEDPEERLLPDDVDTDDMGIPHGMFSGKCEFCSRPIKPFPTVEKQLKMPPESLYCCNDYREFVEFVTSTNRDMEDEQSKKTKLIDIKPHEHVGSKQDRNAAKEKAVQRMREREIQRRQQEASGMKQDFFASPQSAMSTMNIPNAPFGTAATVSTGSPQRFLESANFARQMKTINYQLSSQKCLDEGWTVRAPSPLFDDLGDDVFTPEPLNPDMIADGKPIENAPAFRPDSEFYRQRLRERPLIEKFYESGQKFLTMFPDGTGNVFYPSGNLALLISSVKLGQYNYTIHHDLPKSGVAAAFEPNGLGYCHFPNGAIRLYLDQYGGLELDHEGAKKRKWSWKDQVTHVHAPPFQPICIGLNREMGVRVMTQDNITLTFSSNKRSCRFNMGARLKLVAPENAPLKEVDEGHIFLEEKKAHVESILSKVENLLKFPNNPKLDKMLPPLHVTSRQVKTERLKQDRALYLAQQSERDKKQNSIPAN